MNIYTIYKATNLINNKVYVGYDSNWPKRKYEHKQDSKTSEQVFYRAIRKYGWENFHWEILYQSTEGLHTKNIMENYFIVEYNSYIHFEDANGYNMTLGGEGTIGYVHNNATKQKISENLKGKTKGVKKPPRSEEYKSKMSKSKKGTVPWNKGKTMAFAPRNRKKKIKPWNKGKTGVYSKSTLENMSKNGGHAKGKRWYNDGKKDYHIFPEEALFNFVEGRIFKERNMEIKICPYCGKCGSGGNMSRYHFDNCKNK